MSFLQIKQGKERNCLSQSFYCLNYTKREAGGVSLLVIKICFWNLILFTCNTRPPWTKVAWVWLTDLALCLSLVGWFSLFPFLKFFFPLFLWFDFRPPPPIFSYLCSYFCLALYGTKDARRKTPIFIPKNTALTIDSFLTLTDLLFSSSFDIGSSVKSLIIAVFWFALLCIDMQHVFRFALFQWILRCQEIDDLTTQGNICLIRIIIGLLIGFFFRSVSKNHESSTCLCNNGQYLWTFQILLPEAQHGEIYFCNSWSVSLNNLLCLVQHDKKDN